VSADDEELIRCFQATFGDLLLVPDIPGASVETLEGWDSLQTIVLIAVLEEAFEVRIPATEYSGLRSFASVRDYLRERRLLR
jgi:acyl carrier protein